MATYTVPSGDRIWAGRGVVMPDPDDVSFTWPPGANCSIPEAEGVNAPLHPKVLDLGDGGWSGYRYWMAFTPYPIAAGNDLLENPCVVASNDGDTWVALSPNPIEPAPMDAVQSVTYNSDTHLLFVNNVLYLIWRHFSNATGTYYETFFYRASSDGANWSDKQQFYQSTHASASISLSPSIEYHEGTYWMWVYNRNIGPIACQLMTAQSLTGPWSARTLCSLLLPDQYAEPWHFDVVRIPNGWAMILCARARGVQQDLKKHLWVAISADGVNWNTTSAALSEEQPDMYRPSFVKKRDNSGFDAFLTDYSVRKIRRLSLELGV